MEIPLREGLREQISHWAFLPITKFKDTDSLRQLRPEFGTCSKIGMIVSATNGAEIKDFVDEDVNMLDTVNDFIHFFEEKKLQVVYVGPTETGRIFNKNW